MKVFFKHLLLPLTAFLWYFVSYTVIWAVAALLVYVFELNWLWVFLCETIFIGLISLVFTLPSLINFYLLDKLYGYSWTSIIFHSIAGLIGVLSVLNLFYKEGFDIGIFWHVSRFKTILLFFPALGLIIGMIYSTGISPFLIKLKKIRNDNKI